MKNFIVLFREPDGRTAPHTEEDITRHRENWKHWLNEDGKMQKAGSLEEAAGIAKSCPN